MELINTPKTIIDPDTGRVIEVTQDMIHALTLCEERVKHAMAEISLALKQIRDQKLYLLLDMNSIDEYLKERFHLSSRQGYRYLQIADSFSNSKHYKEITELPMKVLEEIAKDENLIQDLRRGELTNEDGEIVLVDDIVARGNKELQVELIKQKTKNKDLKRDKEVAEQRCLTANTKLELYQSGDNAEEFRKIKTKQEALRKLYTASGELSSMIQTLDKIEPMDNPEITSLIGSIVGQMRVFAEELEEAWSIQIISEYRNEQKKAKTL